MGFKLLTLINNDGADHSAMDTTVRNSKKSWLAIKDKIDDENILDTFDLLFEGLELSIKNKETEMIKILAQMDLCLVDVLEKRLTS